MKNKIGSTVLWLSIAITVVSFKETGQQTAFRVFENNRYQVIDSAGFFLYYRYQSTEINQGKGQVMKAAYYFSKTGESDIKPLTVENVEEVFRDNTRFRYLLESEFRNDVELTSYDKYLKLYKIKYLYGLSMKEE